MIYTNIKVKGWSAPRRLVFLMERSKVMFQVTTHPSFFCFICMERVEYIKKHLNLNDINNRWFKDQGGSYVEIEDPLKIEPPKQSDDHKGFYVEIDISFNENIEKQITKSLGITILEVG